MAYLHKLTVSFVVLQESIAQLQFSLPVGAWHVLHDKAAMVPRPIGLGVHLQARLQES